MKHIQLIMQRAVQILSEVKAAMKSSCRLTNVQLECETDNCKPAVGLHLHMIYLRPNESFKQ